MTELFLKLLNMSIAAGWIVLAVAVLRLLLKKAPSWINCLLWGIVGLRLLVPNFWESTFSLLPSAQVIPEDIAVSQNPAIHSGIAAVNSTVNSVIRESVSSGGASMERLLEAAAVVWAVGVALMLAYSAVSYLMIRWQVRISLRQEKNVYACDGVRSPFILGTFFPRIYIPSGMEKEQLDYVLAHERAHLQRGDHVWKPLGFLLLSLHWFNPLLWLAYILLCRDIERACDEKVVATLDSSGKTGYAEALLACSVHRRMIMACPVAFGEVSVRSRIKGILRYQRPAFWLVLISVAACTFTAACFLTDPLPCDHQYTAAVTRQPTCTQQGVQTFTCGLCAYSYTEPVEMQEHSYDEGTVVLEASCVKNGILEYHCTACGGVESETIEKTGHSPGEEVYTQEPDCSHTGETYGLCTVCGDRCTLQILPTNDVHDLRETVLREATCAEAGEGVLNCVHCGYSESCTYEQPEHRYVLVKLIHATCAKEGCETERCTLCGHEKTKILRKTDDHYWICYSGGYTQCKICREYKSKSSSNPSYSLWGGTTYKSEEKNLFPVIIWDVAWP